MQPLPQPSPGGPPSWTPASYMQRHPTTWWWFLVPLLTLGFGTFGMIGFAAFKLRHARPGWAFSLNLAAAFVYLAVTVASFTATSTLAPGNPAYEFLVSLSILVCWVGGTGHACLVQHLMHSVEGSDDPAVVQARWRSRRRLEARRIVERDPAMALELRIGRPEIANRSYDDAGLIDVNHVPAAALESELEMTSEQAGEILAVREERGGFASAEEILLYCTLVSPARFTVIRDRLIALPR